YPSVQGDTLGILLGNSGTTLNQPIQESGTGVDVVKTNSGYVAYMSQKKTISGTGSLLRILTANNRNGPITYIKSCKEIYDNGFSDGDGMYFINPTSTSTGSFSAYCDMTTDGGGWTLVAWNKGKSYAIPKDFFVMEQNKSSIANKNLENQASSMNPELFSKTVNTNSAMLKSLVYSSTPIIENSMGNWDYDVTKCSGNLMHTSRTAGCIQSANDNWNSSDRFNIAIGNIGIVPYYLFGGHELCYSGKGWCDFEFYLR
ncbi:MAG: fibrinogen-like YCDxxxxGGGW domain-containing protein, partial [Candidatus Gracilibacteria bacterium]|nr:fibrinogen-like YCDxxxxGGGW domain-containing protein [Candidatus Gracilibacteria bacterium]